ncbi:DNA ligase D, partial [Mumia flava]
MALWIAPMLATLTSRRFDDPDWVFERKLDGERLMAIREDARVRLYSRNHNDVTAQYPEIVEAFAGFDTATDFVVDGELCAMRGEQTSFADLQKRMHVTDPRTIAGAGVTLAYYAFDLPRYDGHDLRGLALTTRKAALADAFAFGPVLRFSDHEAEHGLAMLHHAERAGWEGVMAKRAASTYQAGKRSPDWLKFKVVRGQELVVGGWTTGQGSRKGLGALLVGYYDGDALRYAGKVGTGFDQAMLDRLGSMLEPLGRETSPFVDDVGAAVRREHPHWVAPRLVVEVGFSEWTDAGRLRHPRFQGVRDDKAPAEVVREEPHPI